MKRKTNLLDITRKQEAEFITFSNYTEVLTGAFLSVKTKLFPSMFLCFNIEKLNSGEERENLKKLLVGYYENKLAYLRDYCLTNNRKFEDDCYPLYYLLYTLSKFSESEILDCVYCSEITEQNYNGSFADIILLVNSNINSGCSIELGTSDEFKTNLVNENKWLYGWYNKSNNEYSFNGPAAYRDIRPYYDKLNNPLYNFTCNLNNETDKKFILNTSKKDILEFNVIIPLFDLVNEDSINSYNITQNNDKFGLDNADGKFRVPFGIYFTGDPIKLKTTEGISPSWSLTLATQFAPFLYGSYNNPTVLDKTETAASFNTFAETLTRQNRMLDKFDKMEDQIKLLSQKVYDLQKIINTLNR